MRRLYLGIILLCFGCAGWFIASQRETSPHGEAFSRDPVVTTEGFRASPRATQPSWWLSSHENTPSQPRAKEEPRDTLLDTLSEFDDARHSITVDLEGWVFERAQNDPDMAQKLGRFLLDDPPLPETDGLVEFTRPLAVTRRMAAIDILGTMAASVKVSSQRRAEALDQLLSIASDGAEPARPGARRLRRADRYDAIVAVTRVDPEAAARAFGQASKDHRPLLQQGIMAGLVDRGAPNTRILDAFADLLHRER